VTHVFGFVCHESIGTPTEGRLLLSLPLPVATLHVGISFVSKDIRDHSALHFHFNNNEECMVNLIDFIEVETGISFSCSVVYHYFDEGQGAALLNVTLLSNPSPTSRLLFISTQPNVVPFIDQFTVICQDIGDSPTAFNYCYSAFA
jgi:hypothetical protein